MEIPLEASTTSVSGLIRRSNRPSHFSVDTGRVTIRYCSFTTSTFVVGYFEIIQSSCLFILSATCFAYVFRSLGGDYIVEELIEKAGLGSWGLLFLLMGMTFLLGFFLDWVEITLIILPIFAPLVVLLDFGDHVTQLTGLDGRKETMVWFLVLMAINLQTSFLTPPFGFALFYLKGVAPPEVKTISIYRGVIPFVIIQLIGLGIVIYEPQVALSLSRW